MAPRRLLGLHAAAYLSGLSREAPGEVFVFVATHHRRRDQRWRFVEAVRLGLGEPSRTRTAQTVVDLSAELADDAIVSLLAESVGRGRVRSAEVVGILDATPRHPKRALLRDLLAEVTAGSQSPLELRYTRDVERAHQLPLALRQSSPVAGYRTDGWYPDHGLVVELDGKAYHSGAHALDDMDRDNAHLLAGLVTLRFGWRQVTANPCAVAAKVAQALRWAGWTGAMKACPRCPKGDRRTFRT